MRIGFDITPLCVPQSGVGTYTANVLSQLRSLGEELIPLYHRPLLYDPNFEHANGGFSGKEVATYKRVNKTVWMQCILPFQLSRLGLNVSHFTNSVAPLFSPCPTIVTIHD